MQQYFYLQKLAIMLPALRKINDRQFSATDTKVYYPPRELSQYEPKRQHPSHQSSRNNPKVKVGGGFKIAGTQQDPTKGESMKVYQSHNNYNSRTLMYSQKKSSSDLNQEIRLIERKIRQCQKKIQDDKKRKLQQDRKDQQNRYDQDFQQVIRKELQMQGYRHDQQKGFDYLTNPGGAPPEQQQQQQPQPQSQPHPIYSISDGIQKLERFYENSLKKKFERREAAHKACRKKTPKLFITHKTNTLSKVGKPLTEEQHKFRVMTKQTTPQQIYPVIPNFAVVKDNLSKNIVAYLGDYKPFIDKTKQRVQKQVKNSQQDIVVENTNKSITVSN